MRSHNSRRFAHRRDGGLRQIRSDGGVSYPGVELAPDAEIPAVEPESDGSRLAPVRDTGIAVQTRLSRQQEGAARRQRMAVLGGIAVVIAFIAAAIGWRYVSDRVAASTPLSAEASAANEASAAGPASATATSGAQAGDKASPVAAAVATPVFASYRTLKLHLPIPLTKLTEIGFHQASYAYARPMRTPLKDANNAKTMHDKSTHRDLSKQPVGADAVMTGFAIRMWRNRPGRPDTAADVGAKSGTTVLAPVSGTVVKIKPYLLYGKYPDYELHIHPDGTKGIDLVMIHLTHLSCSVGDHVDGGVTSVARVRKLSDKFFDQLAEFTRGGGDHVHVQVNDANYPGYKGLVGAISVDSSKPAGGGTPTSGGSTSDTGSSDYNSGD